MDRAGIVTAGLEAERAPRRGRGLLRLAAPVAVLGGLAVKFAGSLKVLGLFASVGGYALIWGWGFGVGVVALIAVHEAGHWLEARRQGLRPSLPVFVPFLGAYVAVRGAPFDPWRNGLISIAGPVLGGIGALGLLVAGVAADEPLLRALAYTGFFLNLVNLIPLAPLDGGLITRSIRLLRRGAGRGGPALSRRRAWALGGAFAVLAAALALGMLAAHVPQDRL